FSVVCTEDAPFISDEEITRAAEGTWIGEGLARNMLKVCDTWPRGQLDESYRAPVSSETPVLLLSGALDPVTPPSWGEVAKKTLPNSLHLVVDGVSHNTMSVGCVRRSMADFVERGSVQGLDDSCGKGLKALPV